MRKFEFLPAWDCEAGYGPAGGQDMINSSIFLNFPEISLSFPQIFFIFCLMILIYWLAGKALAMPLFRPSIGIWLQVS